MTVESCVRPALVSGPPNRKKPYNKHLISLVFSVRTVNYGSSFFPSIYGPRASRLGQKNSVRNLQHGPKTRLIRGIYLRKTSTQRVKWQLPQVFVRSSAVSSFVSSEEEIPICHRRGMRGSPVQFRFSENTALPTMKFELLCLQNRIAERS